MENKKVVRKKKKIVKKHIVVFQDVNNQVLSTVFVADGGSAQAPAMDAVLEEKQHHKVVFSGWDQNLEEIHSNLVVHPVYQEIPKEYLIMYFHENGKILGSETVPYGMDAKAAFQPKKEETEEFRYHFAGWSCDLHHIDGDRMAKARFRRERKRFLVRFFGDNHHLLKEEMVFYGNDATAPVDVSKEEDFTYRYHFTGWDAEFTGIKNSMNVNAIFQPEYKEYRISFYEEEKLIEEKIYHYNDSIDYPVLEKKGYDFLWQDDMAYATESKDIYGHWEYAHGKGRRYETSYGLFEIVDPSTVSGTARCLEYRSGEEKIQIPEKIKLGDYYYTLAYLGGNAFSSCENARIILCSKGVKYLEKRCFSSMKRLEMIHLGSGLVAMEAEVFADCNKLKKISSDSVHLKKVAYNSFGRMNHRVEFCVKARLLSFYEKLLQRPIREKGLIISSR